MKVIDETRNWKGKPKELVAFLTESIGKDEKLFSQVIEILKTGSRCRKRNSCRRNETYLEGQA
jgi:hypothetical protein